MRTVDLFCGCGGMSLGFQRAGFEVVAAIDYWKPALEVYRTHFSHPVVEADLSQVGQSIELTRYYRPEVVVGGPPCQDFSHAGKRNEEGARADLTVAFARIVAGTQAPFFVMENVDQIHKSKRLVEAKAILRQAGYGLDEITLEANQYGVPQYRKRYFLLGRLYAPNSSFDFSYLNPSDHLVTVREYFRQQGISLDTEFYYRHPRNYSRRAIYSIDEPSPTIRGVNRPIPQTYSIHPLDAQPNIELVRPMTTIERSYVQTFPKDFAWVGNKTNLEQMIGNAVPVLLAQAVARCLLECARHHPRRAIAVQDSLFVQ
jgi:DNA (cytosine-5)-methyltransferase 1